VLQHHCHQQYRKASQSPHGTLQALLGFNGVSKAASQILEGNLFENVDEECHPGVVELFTAMAVPEGMRDVLSISICISEQDFRIGMRSWKKTTSISPSGRHLGHYKDGKTRYWSC
jgi:hypothetical protein